MTQKKGPIDWIREKLTQSQSNDNGIKPFYLLILLVLGGIFMLIGTFYNNEADPQTTAVYQEETSNESTETFGKNISEQHSGMKVFEEQYENQLKEALEEIVGVSNVTVVVNVEATERSVFEKNVIIRNQITSEEDREGGKRKIEDQSSEDQVVIIREGDKEIPVILETKKPNIKGVLVVAGGAENIQVKKWIIEAVTRVLDVPSHKVAVMPRKSKGDS